ncbi:MAG: hypothetical protein NT062_08325 [Proteobacteria bacterium]|nr:hypothetical protein [Pseudomonadota bacterium]
MSGAEERALVAEERVEVTIHFDGRMVRVEFLTTEPGEMDDGEPRVVVDVSTEHVIGAVADGDDPNRAAR